MDLASARTVGAVGGGVVAIGGVVAGGVVGRMFREEQSLPCSVSTVLVSALGAAMGVGVGAFHAGLKQCRLLPVGSRVQTLLALAPWVSRVHVRSYTRNPASGGPPLHLPLENTACIRSRDKSKEVSLICSGQRVESTWPFHGIVAQRFRGMVVAFPPFLFGFIGRFTLASLEW